MTCVEIPLLPCLIAGGLLALVIYRLCAKRKGIVPNVHLDVHSITLGFLLGGAIHLFYAGICPNELVEIYDKDEKRLHPPEVSVKVELLHRLDIWLGTGFLIFTTCKALLKIYRNPADH